jgi:hypothetical protein
MKIILLHSAPRSGSTWIQTLFDIYPNIKTVYQPLFSFAFKNKLDENADDQMIAEFCQDLMQTNDPFCLRETDYHTNNGETPMPSFSKTHFDTLLIKNVHHHYIAERFLQCGHKLVALIRDPRAVVQSQLDSARETDPDWLQATTKNAGKRENYFGYLKWKEVLYLFDRLKKNYPQQVHIVKYENLVNEFITTARGLTNFLELDFEPVLQAQQILTSKDSNYEYSVFRTSVNPHKWKQQLQSSIIKYISNDIQNDPIISKYYFP